MNYVLRAILLSQQMCTLGINYLDHGSNELLVNDRPNWYDKPVREIASEPDIKIWNNDILVGVY